MLISDQHYRVSNGLFNVSRGVIEGQGPGAIDFLWKFLIRYLATLIEKQHNNQTTKAGFTSYALHITAYLVTAQQNLLLVVFIRMLNT